MALERRQRRHHDLQSQQRRSVVADRAERRDDLLRRLGPRDHLAQRGDLAGLRPLAIPEQEADLLERGVRDQFLDRIAAIGELPFDNRTDRRLGDDHAVGEPSLERRLRDGHPRRCVGQAASATSTLGGDEIAQRVDIGAAIERLAPDTAAIAVQPAAADVGVERAELDAELRGRFVRGDHAGTVGFARRHRDYHAIAARRASSRRSIIDS